MSDFDQVIISEGEIIILRQCRIGSGIAEYRMDIHHLGIRPLAIVQTGVRRIKPALLRGEINHPTHCHWPFVDSVQRADAAARLGEINPNLNRFSSACALV